MLQHRGMAIMMTFPDPADSPTGSAAVRLRYDLPRDASGKTTPRLYYRTATAVELTRPAWHGYQAAGATITADTDHERQIVHETLGADVSHCLRALHA